MIINLFSSFDPSTSILTLNWTSSITVTIVIIINLSNNNSNIKIIFNAITSYLSTEVNANLQNTVNNDSIIIFTGLFTILSINNLMALSPFVFSYTAHIVITLPAALTIWASLILFTINASINNILIHLVPVGTPSPLLPIIVLIEIISNIIRPITLSVRLAANIIAGHLLLILLSNFIISSNISFILSTPIIIPLTVLEIGVSIIQAYVFITLCSLYYNELQ